MTESQKDDRITDMIRECESLCSEGQIDKALELGREAVKEALRLYGEDAQRTADALSVLAQALQYEGDLAGAEDLYRRALKIRENILGPEHEGTATSLNDLALLLRTRGDLVEGEQLCRRAMAIRRNVLGPEHPLAGLSIGTLALLRQSMGDLVGAEPLFREALSIYERSLGPEDQETANGLSNLGNLLLNRGDLVAAEPLIRRSLEIRKKILGTEHLHTATSLCELACILTHKGDWAEAEKLFRVALSAFERLLGPNHVWTATTRNNLGEVLGRKGDLSAAEPLIRRSLDIRMKALGQEHSDVASSARSLASLASHKGLFTNALQHARRALQICQKRMGPEHPDTAFSLDHLGAVLYLMGEWTDAESRYRQALEIRENVLGQMHPLTGSTLAHIAGVYAATDRESEALKLLLCASEIDDRMIGQVFSISSDSQRLAYLESIRGNLWTLLSLVASSLADSPEAVLPALDVVLRRKAIAFEAQAVQRDAVLGGKYPHLDHMLHELHALRQQIMRKTMDGPGEEGPEAYQQLLDDLSAKRDRLESHLAREIPEMNFELRLQKADRNAVAISLPPDCVLVEFLRYCVYDFRAVPAKGESRWKPARYLAFVLPAGAPDDVKMVDLGEADPVDEMIATFRACISGGGSARGTGDQESGAPSDTRAVGALLRAAVFDRLVPHLGECKRLLIAPDGGLSLLPFDVLPQGESDYLIDKYRISYLGCGRDALRFGVSLGDATEPLVLADPDFDLAADRPKHAEDVPAHACAAGRKSRDLDPGREFKRLPYTRKEGKAIARMLGVTPVLDKKALEERVKDSKSPRILHIATHGFFLEDQKVDPEMPARSGIGRMAGDISWPSGMFESPLLRSGLALAGANTWLKKLKKDPDSQDGPTTDEDATGFAHEDGMLTAEDVTGLDLLGTDLVVLSACMSGVGEVKAGEGVFGLRRSFAIAGAKTLVMSLWPVDDEITLLLMKRFYKALRSGKTCVDALRDSQLLIKGQYATPDNPAPWGAFICQGEAGRVFSKTR